MGEDRFQGMIPMSGMYVDDKGGTCGEETELHVGVGPLSGMLRHVCIQVGRSGPEEVFNHRYKER